MIHHSYVFVKRNFKNKTSPCLRARLKGTYLIYLCSSFPTILQIKKAIISAATTVEPTGVPAMIEKSIPAAAQKIEIAPEKITTGRKLLNIRIAERAGKITKAEISKEPTKFIASTIISAVITAINRLYAPALTPVALAKLSSKVTANILL